MPGGLQGREAGLIGGVDFGGNRHEGAIGAVLVRPPERFVDDRQCAGLVFAGALGDELFDPEAERGEAGRQRQRQFVAPVLDRGGDEGAELEPGIGVVVLAAACRHGLGAGEQIVDRRADQRGRYQAEQ